MSPFENGSQSNSIYNVLDKSVVICVNILDNVAHDYEPISVQDYQVNILNRVVHIPCSISVPRPPG